jgi:two-component system, LytTR family, sensor kinase
MGKYIFQKTIPSDGIYTIKAETLFGNITLVGAQMDEITVFVSSSFKDWTKWVGIDYEEFERKPVIIELENQTLTIKTAMSSSLSDWFKAIGVSLKISIPLSIFYEIHLETQAGNCKLEQIKGKCFVKTKAGNIEISEASGDIKAKTGAGNIEVDNCKIRLNASTAAGNIEIKKSEGDMILSTRAGNVELEDVVGNIHADTGAGNVEANHVSGLLKAMTSMGEVEIKRMHGSVAAVATYSNINIELLSFGDFVNAESKTGNIKLQLPNTEGVTLDIKANRIRPRHFDNFEGEHTKEYAKGELNGGGIPVTVSTEQGNVRVKSNRGSTFESVNRSFKEMPFNLPSNFFIKSIQGILLSLSICILLIYGFNSILYFTFGIFNPDDPLSTLYKGLLISNICHGITALVCVYIFIQYYEHKLVQNWIKYGVLIGITLIGAFCTDMVIGILFWRRVRRSIPNEDPTTENVNWTFSLIPIIVACIYFYFWQRSQKITRKISEQEFQLLNLDKLKTKAELDALQARINPHFLYNSLNSIAGLVHHDPDKAEQMTLLLSKLFRYTTGTKDQHFNTILDELEIVKTYLAIEQVRFEDRLKYTVSVENGLENKEIPRFLLQPIVENAIKHGISKVTEQGEIHVNITQEGDVLRLAVHDNGPAFSDTFFTGYGLQSIQDKLKLLYGVKAQLDIQNTDYKQVIIKIPC